MLKERTMQQRKSTGSLVVLMPAAILIAIVGIGAFALDVTHNISVRTELQNATDAAALAGARELLDPSTQNNADGNALTVAEQNTADGSAVSNSTTGCTVTTQWEVDNAENTATITVEGSKVINNVFAKLFGRNTDTVNTRSVARAYRSITAIPSNAGFPMAVSIDTTQGGQEPLYRVPIGSQYTFYINSQQYKNAAWTSFTMNNTPASWLNNAIDMSMGFTDWVQGYIPGCEVGDQISFTNGVASQKKLAGDPYVEVLVGDNYTVLLPCMQGEPPYNQSRECVGFVTFKIESVLINQRQGEVESFTGKIVKGVTKGTGGVPNEATTGAINNGIRVISTGTVKLIS